MLRASRTACPGGTRWPAAFRAVASKPRVMDATVHHNRLYRPFQKSPLVASSSTPLRDSGEPTVSPNINTCPSAAPHTASPAMAMTRPSTDQSGRGFPDSEYRDRFARAQAAMEKMGFDALLISTEESFAYFSGWSSQFWRSPTRPYYLILPREGADAPVAVVPEISVETISHTWVHDIRSWPAPRPEDDGVSLLAHALEELPKKFNTIGVPMGLETHVRMPMNHFHNVMFTLHNQGVKVRDSTKLVRNLRAVKSPLELKKMSQSCHVASHAFETFPDYMDQVLRTTPPAGGRLTERELAREFKRHLLDHGVDETPYLIATSGSGGYPSIISSPSDRPIHHGDVIGIDTGSRLDGYWCDFTRNFIATDGDSATDSPASEAARRAHEILWEATEEGMSAAKPGNTTSDIWRAMVQHIEKRTEGRVDPRSFTTGRLGHGVGLDLTEWPSITSDSEVTLRPGMVLAIEPGMGMADVMPGGAAMYPELVGKTLVHEENIVITADTETERGGARLLSKRAPAHLAQIPVTISERPRVGKSGWWATPMGSKVSRVGPGFGTGGGGGGSDGGNHPVPRKVVTFGDKTDDKVSVLVNHHHDMQSIRAAVRAAGSIECVESVASDTKVTLKEFSSRLPFARDFHSGYGDSGMKRTPLVEMPNLAKMLGISKLLMKDEGKRMGLKAFKGLGVSFAVNQLIQSGAVVPGETTLTTMTDGNHGRALAHVAAKVGCDCVVFVPKSMVPARRQAIEDEGAKVVEVEGSYDDAIAHVKQAAEDNGWALVSDTAWDGYTDIPLDIMTGYATIFREVEEQMADQYPSSSSSVDATDKQNREGHRITHVLLQAGVGGFAAAGAAHVALSKSDWWHDDVKVIIVEPTDSDCILENAMRRDQIPMISSDSGADDVEGWKVDADSQLFMCQGETESLMSGLNCGVPSTIAWPVLRDYPSCYVAVGDNWAKKAMVAMSNEGVVTGESGGAGVAALMGLQVCDGTTMPLLGLVQSKAIGLNSRSVVLCVSTEADTDEDSYRDIMRTAQGGRAY